MDAIAKYDACVDALRGFVHDAGFTDVLLGLSGGIDSALVCAMCADAFGAGHVHAFLLPGPYSSDHSVEDAAEEARVLGVEAQVVRITGAYEALAPELAAPCGGSFGGVAAQNTQARLRMTVLMAVSNARGWLLVNTGNKSEAAMGYSTLYGDTAGAFAPIGGLYKTDVYACARARNERAVAARQPTPIPQRVLAKPPSAELAPGQTDEASLGLPYAQLDPILIEHFEHGATAAQIAALPQVTLDAPAIEALLSRARSYAYKRALEPPFPQVGFY